MNIVSWVIRSSEGYKLSKPIEMKITHVLFVDDLKGYCKPFENLKFMLNLICRYMLDAGLAWNPKKCKFVAFKRGKNCFYEDITLNSGATINCLKEGENYEFMGVPQHTKMDEKTLGQDLMDIVQKRSHIIWSSELSDINKCKASNTFVNSAVEYYFWTVKFTIEVVKEMDNVIRKVMNIKGAKHTNQMNAINYLPRNKGGRGLRSLEETYKMTKVKLAAKLINDNDRRLDIVRQYHKISLKSSSFSIFKDAKRYARDFDLEIELTTDGRLIMVKEENEIVEDMKKISTMLKVNNELKNHTAVLRSTWQGLNLSQRIEDENVR